MSQSFDVLLQSLLSPDNAIRRAAEGAWNDMTANHPDKAVESLCAMLGRRTAQDEALRALSAVMLRRQLGLRSDLWFRIQPSTQIGAKAVLLEQVTSEPVRHIRRKITHTVGQLAASATTGEQEWPELLAVTQALCGPTQHDPALREVGLELVDRLMEYVWEVMEPHAGGLVQVFVTSLGDENIRVRVAALKATCSFLQELMDGTTVDACQGLIPRMLEVLEVVVTTLDEEVAQEALGALTAVAEKQPRLLKSHLGHVGQVMLTLSANPALEVATRAAALEFMTSLAENAPSTLRVSGSFVVQAMVPLMVDMLSQMEAGGEEEDLASWAAGTDLQDDDGGDDEGELNNTAAEALHRVSLALGGRAVLGVALPVIETCLQSQEARKRRGGLEALALLGPGCKGDMLAELPRIVPNILRFGEDPDPRVRHALISCLGQMSDDFGDMAGDSGGPSFLGLFHAQVMPILSRGLSGPNAGIPRIQAAAAGAIVSFCSPEHAGDGEDGQWIFTAHGAPTLEGLLLALRQSPSARVREQALTAVGTMAQAIGPAFTTYYGTFMPLAKDILRSTGTPLSGKDDTGQLRGKAMEAIALMGQVVGRERFRGDAQEVLRLLLSEQSVEPGDPQASYLLMSCARIAGVLREEFTPYLQHVVPPLIRSLSMDTQPKLVDADAIGGQQDLEGAGMTSFKLDLRGAGAHVLGINTSLMQEKKVACQTLFQYTLDLGVVFAPYVDEVLRHVLPNMSTLHAVDVKVISAAVVPKLVEIAVKAGAASRDTAAAQAVAQRMLDSAVAPLTQMVEREGGMGEDRLEPQCMAADALSDCLRFAKESAHREDMASVSMRDDMVPPVVAVLKTAAQASMQRTRNRLARQQEDEEFDYVGAVQQEEEEVWENDLLTSVVDGIGWLIKARGPAMLPLFQSELQAFVLPLLGAGTREEERALGMCMCIDVVEHCGPGAQGLVSTLAPALMEGMGPWRFQGAEEPAPTIHQAAAYGLGVLAEKGGAAFDADCPECLRLLVDLVQDPNNVSSEEMLACRDNAVSAVLKLVVFRRAALAPQVDVDALLSTWLTWLPLREDVPEAQDCHGRLLDLVLAMDGPVIGSQGANLPQLLAALAAMAEYQPRAHDEEGHRCTGAYAAEETEADMWARQLVTKGGRKKIAVCLGALKATVPAQYAAAWGSLGAELQQHVLHALQDT